MKKTYETPSIEVVKFQYRDQVVVASGLPKCEEVYSHSTPADGTQDCISGDKIQSWTNEKY